MMKIHYMTHNFSDWDSQTKHMTRNQRAIYLDLRTLYFSTANANNGRIDDDFDLLCFRLACHSEQDKTDLRLVLADKFKKIGNAYRHADWDKEIKAIVWEIKKGGNTGNIQGNTGNIDGNTQGNTGNVDGNTKGNTPVTAYERKLKSEAKRQKILAELADIDVIPSDDAKMKELEILYKAHFGHDFTDSGNVQGNIQGNTGNVDGNTQGNTGNAKKPSNNHKPLTINHKPITKESEYNTPTPNHAEQNLNPTADKPSVATQSKKQTKSDFDPKTYPIGDCVDNELWCDFVDMRKSIKKPLTEQACKLLVKDFNDWNAQGLSANKALGESIKNSWQGVFKEKAMIGNQSTWQPPQPPSRMDELRQMAQTNPTNIYVNDLPDPDNPFSANPTNFIGVTYE